MIGDVQCPLCGAPINVYKITERDGMDGVHHEWRFRCFHCGIVNADYPADNFYGRKYSATKDDAIAEWNQNIKSFTKQAQIIPLKAQEPRVMTLEEIQNWDAAVFMDEDGNPMCIKMLYSYEIGSGKTIYHGYTFVDSDGDKIFFPARDFNKNWRCWTSRPTEEQRKAVEWE